MRWPRSLVTLHSLEPHAGSYLRGHTNGGGPMSEWSGVVSPILENRGEHQHGTRCGQPFTEGCVRKYTPSPPRQWPNRDMHDGGSQGRGQQSLIKSWRRRTRSRASRRVSPSRTTSPRGMPEWYGPRAVEKRRGFYWCLLPRESSGTHSERWLRNVYGTVYMIVLK